MTYLFLGNTLWTSLDRRSSNVTTADDDGVEEEDDDDDDDAADFVKAPLESVMGSSDVAAVFPTISASVERVSASIVAFFEWGTFSLELLLHNVEVEVFLAADEDNDVGVGVTKFILLFVIAIVISYKKTFSPLVYEL